MKNVEYELKDGILTIKVDVSKTFGESKSGKSTIIASTEGNKRIKVDEKREIWIGLNIYEKV